jgi:hypothetical protein
MPSARGYVSSLCLQDSNQVSQGAVFAVSQISVFIQGLLNSVLQTSHIARHHPGIVISPQGIMPSVPNVGYFVQDERWVVSELLVYPYLLFTVNTQSASRINDSIIPVMMTI